MEDGYRYCALVEVKIYRYIYPYQFKVPVSGFQTTYVGNMCYRFKDAGYSAAVLQSLVYITREG
jgi:hypothetical protein